MTSYTKDIVADFGAPTNGTSDTAVKWQDFINFLSGLSAGDDVTLNVPAHTYQFLTNAAPDGRSVHLTSGLIGGLTVVVNGNGSVFTNNGAAPGVGGFFLGGKSIFEDNLHSARIESVLAGSSTVRLVTLSQHSRFTVGQCVLVAGMDLQGAGGFPINPAFFDFVTIVAKDTGTGVITFTPPLRDSYLSSWPLYSAGDASHVDCGGPATIYALDSSWDITATFNNCTFFDQNGQIYGAGRSLKFAGGGCTNATQGVIPSVNGRMRFEDFDQPTCNLEVDKCVGSLEFLRGSVRRLTFQSMSIKSCKCDGLAISEDIHGTPRWLVFINGTTGNGIGFGCDGYGTTEAVAIADSVIPAVIVNGGGVYSDITSRGFTMAGGVIRWPKAGNGPIAIAVPGRTYMFVGSKACEVVFRVLAVAEDGTDTIVTTDLSGGFPNIPLNGGTRLDWRTHPCSVWVGSGNSGCADIIDLNNAGAQGAPLYSYSKRSYTGNTLPTDPTATYFQLWGQIESIKTTVSPAFTSATGLLAEILSTPSGDVLSANRASVITYDPKVDMKTPGIRTIVPGSVAGSAGADVMGAAPGNIWLCGSQGINGSRSAAGDAGIVEVEIVADQGISGRAFVCNFT